MSARRVFRLRGTHRNYFRAGAPGVGDKGEGAPVWAGKKQRGLTWLVIRWCANPSMFDVPSLSRRTAGVPGPVRGAGAAAGEAPRPAPAEQGSPSAPAMLSAEDILTGLDADQRRVVTELDGPMRVLAGAGTGKTRAITHRIAYGIAIGRYVPQRVMALTFTTRAAEEMRLRLRSLGAAGVQTRTFHSAALRQLRYFWPQAVGNLPADCGS